LKLGRLSKDYLEKAEQRYGRMLFLLLLGVVVLSLFASYPSGHAILLTAVIAISTLLATRAIFLSEQWRAPLYSVVAVVISTVLVTEGTLSLAIANKLPFSNSSAWAWIGGKRALLLIDGFKSHDAKVYSVAVEAAGKIGKPALSVLISEVENSDPWVRHGAVEALGETRDQTAVPTLIAALKHSDVDVRAKAVKALGKIGDGSVADKLIDTFWANDDEEVRNNVVWSLVSLGEAERVIRLDIRALPGLVNAFRDQSMHIQINANQILIKLDKKAKPALEELIEDNNISVVGRAAQLLVEIDGKSAVLVLKNADLRFHKNDWLNTGFSHLLFDCPFHKPLRSLENK